MEKIIEMGNQINGLMSQLRKECKAWLDKVLDEGKEFDLQEVWDDCGSVCVTYDGGRHPEYNSNAFSNVVRVFKKDGKIYLHTEDCEEYDIERVDTMELYGVCVFINDAFDIPE